MKICAMRIQMVAGKNAERGAFAMSGRCTGTVLVFDKRANPLSVLAVHGKFAVAAKPPPGVALLPCLLRKRWKTQAA
jgi:hypothetical protein